MRIFTVVTCCLGLLSTISIHGEESCCDYALRMLMEGNERYVKDERIHPNQSGAHRETLMEKQEPFAVILSCSDSRIAPELIFDRGLGDTFVVRVAGNVAGQMGLESIQYAVDQLKACLVMVLGHENCGAVKGVVAGGDAIRDMPSIARMIEPAISQAKEMEGDFLPHVIELNVQRVRKQLENDPFLKKFVQEGKLKIVGGYYHLGSGKVTLVP
ncbi:MAG: carbonic anhydrase [Chlamydiae bacterium]|nr:carbonic anhydrase [Chlamydiota bacterium]